MIPNPEQPVSSLSNPTLEDVMAMRGQEEGFRWTPPSPVNEQRAGVYGLSLLTACVVASLALGWWSGRAAARKPPAEQAGSWEQAKAKVLYVVARAPSEALLAKLTEKLAQGVDVRLVTGTSVELLGARVNVVPEKAIKGEGVLVNGISMYALTP